MLSGGVPGFLLRNRYTKKADIGGTKKHGVIYHFFYRLLFCSAFVSVILIAI